MSWFKKLLPSRVTTALSQRKKAVPDGVWSPCGACQAMLYRAEFERNLLVCPSCNQHTRMRARQRLDTFLDPAPRVELGQDIAPHDVLRFRDSKKYKDRLIEARKKTHETEALLAFKGQVHGIPLVAVAFEFDFIGGSMGAAVGARFVHAVDTALAERVPLVAFVTSGGARMQEGLQSLFQMAKTAAALGALSSAGLPYISVLTHPTFGGVSASLALLGDIHLAEPGAMVGFAGPRVIEQTVRTTLPEGFQTAEFLLQHGLIDQVVDRRHLRDTIERLLTLLLPERVH